MVQGLHSKQVKKKVQKTLQKMEAIEPEARKSLFTKQDSLGGFSPDVEGVGGGLPEVRNVGENIGGEEGVGEVELEEEGENLAEEGIFALSCRGEMGKVRW